MRNFSAKRVYILILQFVFIAAALLNSLVT